MTTLQAVNSGTTSSDNSLFLRRAIQGEAAIGLSMGIGFLLASAPVATFLGISQTMVLVLGVAALFYDGGRIIWSMQGEAVDRRLGILSLEVNIAWVVGSIVLLAFNLLPLSNSVWWTVAVLADVVAVFAVLQWVGLRRLGQDK